MRRIVLFMHVSLDGFVAGPAGEMNWIKVDEEIFDYAGDRTKEADTALYGRVTWEMMEAYWPGAGKKPNASKHDKEHSEWYNRVQKVILSRTLKDKINNSIIIGDNLAKNIETIKAQPGREIIIFGSPSAVHSLMEHDLIDDFWLFINPIVLGNGIPLFKNMQRQKLSLQHSHTFKCGVVGVHYRKEG